MLPQKTILRSCLHCSLFCLLFFLPAFKKQIARPNRSFFDVPVTIFFLAAPNAKPQSDPLWQEKQKAIHVLIQRNRKQKKSENGGVLFLQEGELWDQLSKARNTNNFTNTLIQRTQNFSAYISAYMEHDGLSLPAEELLLLRQALKDKHLQTRLQRLPLLGFNFRNLSKDGKVLPLATYKIIPIQGHPVFLSALISGPEPEFDSNPWKRLALELKRQEGMELAILLLNEKSSKDSHDEENEKDSYMDPHLPQSFVTRKLLASKTFFDFFQTQKGTPKNGSTRRQDSSESARRAPSNMKTPPERTIFRGAQKQVKPVSLPASWENQFAHKTLLFISSKKKNRFYRHLAGPYICATLRGYICRIDLLIRKKRLIQLKQQFLSIKNITRHVQEEGRSVPFHESPPF